MFRHLLSAAIPILITGIVIAGLIVVAPDMNAVLLVTFCTFTGIAIGKVGAEYLHRREESGVRK